VVIISVKIIVSVDKYVKFVTPDKIIPFKIIIMIVCLCKQFFCSSSFGVHVSNRLA